MDGSKLLLLICEKFFRQFRSVLPKAHTFKFQEFLETIKFAACVKIEEIRPQET